MKYIKNTCRRDICEIFFLFERSIDPLFMEYDIIKMTATASVGGAYTKGQIFDDSGSQIRLYLIDGVAYVNFEGIGVLWLVGIDLRLKKTPQKKSCRIKSHDHGQFTSPSREMALLTTRAQLSKIATYF